MSDDPAKLLRDAAEDDIRPAAQEFVDYYRKEPIEALREAA